MRTKLLKGLKVEEAIVGEHLVLQGTPCNGFIIIVQGEASITHYIPDDDPVIDENTTPAPVT